MPIKGGEELVAEARRGARPNATTRFIGISVGELGVDVRVKFDACLRKRFDRASLRQALLGPRTGVRPSQPGLWPEAG